MNKNNTLRLLPWLVIILFLLPLGIPSDQSDRSKNLIHVPVLYGYSTCGNNDVETGEGCDDGDTSSGDGCSSSCTVESGYTCNGDPSTCSTTCGDGIKAGNEGCDDDGTTSGDGCSSTCTVESGYSCSGTPSSCNTVCGDRIIAGSEACDDGNIRNNDGCSSSCAIESGWACSGTPSNCSASCGDEEIDGNETCDDGNLTSGDGCSSACATENGYTCTGEPSSCSYSCGDGAIANVVEECDDRNTTAGDGCSDSCTVETYYACTSEPSNCIADCGDSVIFLAENCDDGNENNGDGCSSSCLKEAGWTCSGTPTKCFSTCGDNIVVGDEECEPPSSLSCSSNCMNQSIGGGSSSISTVSGRAENRRNAANESINSDLLMLSDVPVRVRQLTTCGDGKVDIGEECDDGNEIDSDGCSSFCYREIGYCGDELVQRAKGEECEPEKEFKDGKWIFVNAPKCSDIPDATFCSAPTSKEKGCTLEPLPPCSTSNLSEGMQFQKIRYCGDGRKDEVEQCDFGSACHGGQYHGIVLNDRRDVLSCNNNGGESHPRSGDGCSNKCQLEYCGDGIVQLREQCDNGKVCSDDKKTPCKTDLECGNKGACAYNEAINPSCNKSCQICNGLYISTLKLDKMDVGEHIVKVMVENACGVSTVNETRFLLVDTISRTPPSIPAHKIDLKKNVYKKGDANKEPPNTSVVTDKSRYFKGMDKGVLVSVIVTDSFGLLMHGLSSDSFTLVVDGRIINGALFIEDVSQNCVLSSADVPVHTCDSKEISYVSEPGNVLLGSLLQNVQDNKVSLGIGMGIIAAMFFVLLNANGNKRFTNTVK
ncbi:DUF4215 domain-containing protein [Patescibacteria group bacterium]|nr:DUF4215 domain-containing protein [Patescibacteria group bacterium]